MSQKPQPVKFTPEELARIEARKKRDQASKIDPEWQLLAEFGYYYGWQAIQDVRNNVIDIETFNNLLKGARKVWAQKMIDESVVTFTSVAATNSKKPQDVMNKGLKSFYKEVK